MKQVLNEVLNDDAHPEKIPNTNSSMQYLQSIERTDNLRNETKSTSRSKIALRNVEEKIGAILKDREYQEYGGVNITKSKTRGISPLSRERTILRSRLQNPICQELLRSSSKKCNPQSSRVNVNSRLASPSQYKSITSLKKSHLSKENVVDSISSSIRQLSSSKKNRVLQNKKVIAEDVYGVIFSSTPGNFSYLKQKAFKKVHANRQHPLSSYMNN